MESALWEHHIASMQNADPIKTIVKNAFKGKFSEVRLREFKAI